MKLYESERSGNSLKVRIFLGILGLKYESVTVNLHAGEGRTPEFIALNPRSQIPVLVDGKTTVWDSQAILAYLARKYGGETWLPTDAEGLARVMQWLAVSENELLYGLARARAVKRMQVPWNLDQCHELGYKGLNVLESALKKGDWLAADRPTIADLACYPYVALGHEGGITLDGHPAVRAWLKRIENLPGYVSATGIVGQP